MSEVVFNELDAEIREPTVAVETDFDSGRQNVPSLEKRLLLLGYGLSGTASDGEVHEITSEQAARALWGEGSHLAVMAERALEQAPRVPLYGMSYAEDGGAVAASGTVTLATDASASGTLTVTVGGRRVRVGISSGDTPTEVGDDLAAAINGLVNAPFTAANAIGVVTITARNGGDEGNTIRFRSVITSGIGMTATDSGATLASGATPGDPTSVLTGIEGQRFHHIAHNNDDATGVAAVQTHQEARSAALEQKWGTGVWASVDTLANTQTAVAANSDSRRMQVVWQEQSELPIFELAAAFAAERARVVTRNRTLNFHELVGAKPAFDETVWPTNADFESALRTGITPVRPLRSGRVEVVRSVTAKQSEDISLIDTNILEISDFIDEDLINIFRLRYKDAALKVLNPANTPNVLTPARALAVLHERMTIWDTVLDYTQGSRADIRNSRTKAVPNPTDPSRLDIAYPYRPVFGAHVIAVLKTFTTPELV